MREVRYTARFKRDYRPEKSRRHSKRLDALLMEVVNLLAADTPLPRRNVDHPLSGEWKDFRDCHVRPDLILSGLIAQQHFFCSTNQSVAARGCKHADNRPRAAHEQRR
jgi:mRNA interferase YafQ